MIETCEADEKETRKVVHPNVPLTPCWMLGSLNTLPFDACQDLDSFDRRNLSMVIKPNVH